MSRVFELSASPRGICRVPKSVNEAIAELHAVRERAERQQMLLRKHPSGDVVFPDKTLTGSVAQEWRNDVRRKREAFEARRIFLEEWLRAQRDRTIMHRVLDVFDVLELEDILFEPSEIEAIAALRRRLKRPLPRTTRPRK